MTQTTTRDAALKQMLMARRREMQDEMQDRMRSGRTDRSNDVRDEIENSDAGVQGDIALMLLQMRSESLIRIDEALARLDAGKYGSCFDCGGEVAERRLRALPFAVRCQACQERREQEQGRARQQAGQRSGFSLFSETVGV